MLKQKQIDNLSKYCYDISKLVMGIAVVGNFISDKFSWGALWIGLITAIVLLIIGFVIDLMEVSNNDKHRVNIHHFTYIKYNWAYHCPIIRA